MEKPTKTPSAEELLRKILELEKRQSHLRQEISKLMLSAWKKPEHQWSNSGGAGGPPELRIMEPLAMKLTETQYFNIVQSMGQALHIYDHDHRIIIWNRAAEFLYGFTSAEACGKTPTELLVVEPKVAAVVDRILERTLYGETWAGEFSIKSRRGEVFVVITTNTPFRDENKRIVGGMCISSDSRPYYLKKPAKLGFDSPQHLQTSIASKISNLASKVKSKIKMEDNYTDHGGGSIAVIYGHTADAFHSETSTPRGHIAPSPFGVFVSTGTEDHFTRNLIIDFGDESEKKRGIRNIYASKADAWMGKKRTVWSQKRNENTSSGDNEIIASGMRFSSLQVSNTRSSSSSGSDTSVKSNAIIKVERETDSQDYEILWEDLITREQIGQGSCGTVYHGMWYGSDVAVKLFAYQEYPDDLIVSFKQEVSLMKKLRHPNILLFMGAVTSPQNLCIVTEFLPRGSLFRVLQRNTTRLDWKRRLQMAMDIARGMNYLHHCNPPIVHRDLKSSNLLVDKNWTVKVGDFGLSRIKHHTYLKTKSGKGTPQWMAPEVIRNEQADEKSDVYNYGVVLWEIITEKIPWDDLNPMQVIGAVGFMNRRLEIPKDVDPLWASLIESCWRSEPQSRPSFQEILHKLKDVQKKLVVKRRRKES